MARKAELIVHIGLPKTASTYLQADIFPKLDHLRYLGIPTTRLFADRDDRAVGRRTMACCLRRSVLVWQDRGREIFDEMLGGTSDWPGQDVLISDETVGRVGSRPAFLRLHLEALSKVAVAYGFGKIRVICLFRRQDRWYASHYAHESHHRVGAGQRDFERAGAQTIDPAQGRHQFGMLLDYFSLYEQLAASVGDENVAMLPYEELAEEPPAFLDRLLKFLGAEEGILRGIGTTTRPVNVRAAGADSWRLRTPQRSLLFLPNRALSGLGLRTIGRERRIKLSKRLSTKLLSAYSDSNRRLADRLDFDLRRYGYF